MDIESLICLRFSLILKNSMYIFLVLSRLFDSLRFFNSPNSTLRLKAQAFTLIEIIVAITILSIVLTSVFQIYSQIITTSKRLELAR